MAPDSPVAAGPHPPALRQIVLLAAAGRRFGVPIDTLREIVPMRPCTPLPGSAAHVCGLINLRGRIVTTLDLAACLGLGTRSGGADRCIVILGHAKTIIGLVVDEVAGIVRADLDTLSRPAETLRGLDPGAAYLRGVGSTRDGEYEVIDPGELFRTILS